MKKERNLKMTDKIVISVSLLATWFEWATFSGYSHLGEPTSDVFTAFT